MSEQPDTRVEEARDVHSVPVREQGQCALRRFWNSPSWFRRAPPPKSYPPISSIPTTSPERLALASADNASPDTSAKTILYLAYGSNLCAQTFLGFRGIRPISQINVSAPAFDLAFDLPGIPYAEPCFANTRPRKIPKPPIPGNPPKFPPPPYSAASRPTWSKGVYGVVYEVTPEDYATIIKTEGGGRGYHDVLTPCFELPPALHVPEKPPFPDLPKPFLAHTLYAPTVPDLPDSPANQDEESSDDNSDDDGGDKDPRKQPWLHRLFLPTHRPDPDYAQASARYLKLIRDGAREHALPDDYRAYLAQLQPYTITSVSQQIGRFLFLFAALPGMLVVMGLGRLLADDLGRAPRWFGAATTAWMNVLWAAYDGVFKPLFGDGERTVPKEPEQRRKAKVVIRTDGSRSEKNRLLSDW
ncbi:hypothetical protein GQX73_g4610 [Xylaria multiplex]|uniref:gamma-glutamylcyclotransferase n=1 Tax=Xylaria multiplex TaxID=323545 RepID=A0A7C8N871_9PEZI|nr:hypothetical protein GQX73_g4610 [Xylaria multiplex]